MSHAQTAGLPIVLRRDESFLTSLRLDSMTGAEMFLAVALECTGGRTGDILYVRDVQERWPVHLFNARYSPAFYPAAKSRKWVLPQNKGMVVTQKGAARLAELRASDPEIAEGLTIFDKKTPHTFDKALRTIFSGARDLSLADAYVDDAIFDRILDSIPDDANVRLLWGAVSPVSRRPQFDARVKRFAIQYSKFAHKQHAEFHDRFFIVDGRGYMLGPSIKDAAAMKPATLVGLRGGDSIKLQHHFEDLWKDGTQPTQ